MGKNSPDISKINLLTPEQEWALRGWMESSNRMLNGMQFGTPWMGVGTPYQVGTYTSMGSAPFGSYGVAPGQVVPGNPNPASLPGQIAPIQGIGSGRWANAQPLPYLTPIPNRSGTNAPKQSGAKASSGMMYNAPSGSKGAVTAPTQDMAMLRSLLAQPMQQPLMSPNQLGYMYRGAITAPFTNPFTRMW